jgi:hypothetical protein
LNQLALLAFGFALSVVLVVVTFARRTEHRSIARRGVRNAVIASLVVGLVVLVPTAFLLRGEGIFGTITLSQSVSAGLLIGALVGGAFFVVNVVVLAIGLWLRPSPAWALGATLATPVVLAALGYGLISFNSYVAQQNEPTSALGHVQVSISGNRIGEIGASGSTECSYTPAGALSLETGVRSPAGNLVSLTLYISGGRVARFDLGVDDIYAGTGNGWVLGPDTVSLVNGWTTHEGQITFNGIVPVGANDLPDPTERWSGSLTFGCGAP